MSATRFVDIGSFEGYGVLMASFSMLEDIVGKVTIPASGDPTAASRSFRSLALLVAIDDLPIVIYSTQVKYDCSRKRIVEKYTRLLHAGKITVRQPHAALPLVLAPISILHPRLCRPCLLYYGPVVFIGDKAASCFVLVNLF